MYNRHRHEHRHLSNIDCLMANTACFVCFISTVNGHSKIKRKKGSKCGNSSRHITNLKQSIFSFDIYGHGTSRLYVCGALLMNIFRFLWLILPKKWLKIKSIIEIVLANPNICHLYWKHHGNNSAIKKLNRHTWQNW